MNVLHSTLGFWTPGPFEWVVIGIVAVLLFGKRLPEVGRQLGQGFVEFKKGLKGAKDELEDAVKTAEEEEKKPEEPSEEESASTEPYDDEEHKD